MMKRWQTEGGGLWAVLALVVILLGTGLLIYIDRRFGPEASAFFLGLLLGIPFLLVVVLIVGGIYVLVIRMSIETATAQPSVMATATPHSEITYLGVDLGMGAIKLYGDKGGTQLPSFVAVGSGLQTARMAGFARQAPALQIKVGSQNYFVGLSAHDYGRAIENLDYDRLTASPEIVALFYGALTQYIQTYGCLEQPLVCLVGMPLETLTEEQAKTTATAIRRWMKGDHAW